MPSNQVYLENLSPASFAWVPSLLLTILLVSDRKTQLFFFSWVTGWSFSLFFLVPEVRVELGSNSEIFFWLPYCVLPIIGFLYVYLRSRQLMQEELDQEMEWQLRDAKMAEISEIGRNLEGVMRGPIKSLREHLDGLKNKAGGDEERSVAGVEKEIEELVNISQSFSWKRAEKWPSLGERV